MKCSFRLLALGISLAISAASAADSFYTRPAVFSTRPSDTTTLIQSVDRFGPVGIGIELHPPAFVMKVKNVEEGWQGRIDMYGQPRPRGRQAQL